MKYIVASVGSGLYYYSQSEKVVELDEDCEGEVELDEDCEGINYYDPQYKIAEFATEPDAYKFISEHDHEYWGE